MDDILQEGRCIELQDTQLGSTSLQVLTLSNRSHCAQTIKYEYECVPQVM